MDSFREEEFKQDNNFNIGDLLEAGSWEYDVEGRTVKWSDGFYRALGYGPAEIPSTPEYFFEHLLYHEDKPTFLHTIYQHNPGKVSKCQIRLLTKLSGYRWFRSMSQKTEADGHHHYIIGAIIDIHHYKTLEMEQLRRRKQNDGINRLAKTAGWQLNPNTMELTLSAEAYDIFELQEHVPISLDEAETFLEPNHQTFSEHVKEAITLSKPFDAEHLCRTARDNRVWLRVKAVPFIDDEGRCISVQGIFQDIDSVKSREKSFKRTINQLKDQNKQLQSFAFIVSHNLRSNTGNLKFMVNLFEQTNGEKDRTEVFEHIKSVSESLSATIDHLNEIVKIQADLGKGKKKVAFNDIYENVVSGVKSFIENTRATIETDFSAAPEVSYVPAYLESIFQNLITNSLKYRHPDRAPHIRIQSQKIGQHVCLFFEDNGRGIDLKLHGNRIFGMYKTFHDNPDARGMGLFMTRQQIEALGGSIEVASEVNVGTKFSITLA